MALPLIPNKYVTNRLGISIHNIQVVEIHGYFTSKSESIHILPDKLPKTLDQYLVNILNKTIVYTYRLLDFSKTNCYYISTEEFV